MKIYGKDGKEYKDVESCVKAEKLFDEKLKKQKEALEKKEKARKQRAEEVNVSYRNYIELRNSFIKDYGKYHTYFTINDIQDKNNDIFDLINCFFN